MTPASRRRSTSSPLPELTTDQEQALRDVDVALGRLRSLEPVCAGLRRLTLASLKGDEQATYLTLAGWTERDRLIEDPPTAPTAGSFTAATGYGSLPDRQAHGEAARLQWQTALERRRLTSTEMWIPASLERRHLVGSVALTLEASGAPPAELQDPGRCLHTGYLVSELTSDAVRVDWKRAPPVASSLTTDDGLAECRALLVARGWNAERYLATRRRPYLVVWPAGQREPLL
jgi:hypothetical protein